MKLRKILLPLFSSLLLTMLCGCGPLEPIAPTNLKVTLSASKANIVDLSWKKERSALVSYWVYYGTHNNPYSAECYSHNITSTKCSIPLSESGTYYFWVRSGWDNMGEYGSSYSTVASLDFTVETLDAPSNLTVKNSESTLNTVDLAWDEVDRASYYRVLYNTTNSLSTASTWQESRTDSTTCSVTFSKYGTYYFWVKSCSTDFYDTPSEPSNIATIDFYHEPLKAPTDLKAESTPSGVKLSWTSTRAPHYLIYYSRENDSSTIERAFDFHVDIKDTYFILPDYFESFFESGTTCYFWVKSSDFRSEHKKDTDSLSDFSEVASFTF